MIMTRMIAGKIVVGLLMASAGARLVGRSVAEPPQDSCVYDEACGNAMCKVWESSRFVCEPKQYTVAVWDKECIDKIEAGQGARVEAPISDGEPDRAHSKLIGATVTFKHGCTYRYEVRSR